MKNSKIHSLNLEGSNSIKGTKNEENHLVKVNNAEAQIADLNDHLNEVLNGGYAYFPLEIFPQQLQDLIYSGEQNLCFNRDFFASAILSACSTAIGNSVSLYNGSYKVKAILWICIVGSRGTGKSHPLSYGLKPLSNLDTIAFEKYLEKKRNHISSGNDTEPPKLAITILNDFTPEKLAQTLDDNPNGVIILQDEIMGWINSFDRYSNNSDQQMYLSLWNGTELNVDRKSSESIRVTETNVNILGGIQPEVLPDFVKKGRSQDGFLDRFLFCYPKTKPVLYTGMDIPKDLKEMYHKLITNLFSIPESYTLVANESCKEIFKDWQRSNVIKYYDDPIERAIQAKIETYVWRFALIIEVINQSVQGTYQKTVSADSLKSAIKLAEYYRYNNLKVQDRLSCINPLESISDKQKELYLKLPSDFKRGDIVELANSIGVTGGSLGRFLHNKKLFNRYSYGYFRKVF